MIAVTGYWFWPRSDGRFVGKWAVTVDGSPGPASIYEFSSSGTGTVGQNSFLWNVEGSNFIFGARGFHSSSVLFPAYLTMRNLSRAIFGIAPALTYQAATIVKISEDEFILDDDETPGQPTERMTFRRVRD